MMRKDFLCTGCVSYTLFILLLISNKGLYGWGGGQDKVNSLCPTGTK
jgi:hypothetical protein